MPLRSGSRLGAYEIVGPLGAGGMGEVYRARDLRLGREVAIKILPADVEGDPARRQRFEQEARHIATLNHPNILAIFDVGTRDDVAYMVTELIDGEPLREAKFSPRKMLDIAAQIADGLAAAHAAGVTHRDLKPDNVMVTRDGRAKLLDFGVAKATGPSDGDLTRSQTQIGSVIGTVGYMAPEQVRGAAVDHRADIFAFGALLYELVGGARAFAGDTAPETMTAILKHDPPELPVSVPASVRQIVKRCLEKQPDERFQSARDLAFALRQAATDSTSSQAAMAHVRRSRVPAWSIAVACLAIGVIGGMMPTLRWANARDSQIDPIRLSRFSSDPMREGVPAFSPDGRSIAYRRIGALDNDIVVQLLDAATPVNLVRAVTAISAPVWTSDGTRVCYTNLDRDLLCVSAAGGTSHVLLRDVTSPRFPPDGTSLLFVRAADGGPAVFASSPPGTEPIRRTDLPLPRDFAGFELSPDGTKILIQTESRLDVMQAAGGRARSVALPPESQPWASAWFPDSRHIALAEVTRDPIAFRLVIADTGSSARRLVHRAEGVLSSVAASPDGRRIAFASGQAEWDVHEFSMDGRHMRPIAASVNMDRFPAWSPQGDRLLFVVGGPGHPDTLWTADDGGSHPSQLLTVSARGLPTTYRFSPDGARIVYSDGTAVRTVSASGGRPVTIRGSTSAASVCWSPDGEWIWYSDGPPPTLRKVHSQGGEPIAVRQEIGRVLDCSPDGKWIAAMGRTGFVIVSTDGKEVRQLAGVGEYSSRADNTMLFGDKGRILYALGLDRRSLAVIDVETAKPLRAVTFQIPPDDVIEGFSVHPDGTRVLLTTGFQRDDIWLAEGFAQPATGWRRWFRHWE